MIENEMTVSVPLEVVKASEIEPKEVKWLWYPYIPFGKVTLLQGDSGDGKSKLMLSIAALLSNGEPRRRMLPDYGTVSMKGTQYYRNRVTDQQGRRVSLYARTREELYQKEQEAIQQIENKTYRCSTPTVEEYCEKWLLMQSAQIRMTTLIDYTSKVKNLALLAVVYQNFSLQCFAKEIRWSYTLDFSVFSG